MEIGGKGLAPDSPTRGDGPHRVEIGVGNLENHGPIEKWLNHFFASRGILIPQFQLAAEVWAPILVQVDHHRQATMQTTIIVSVGVCMNLKSSTLLHDVKSSSTEVRVGKKRFDSGEFSQEVEEGSGVQHRGKGVGVLLEIDSRAQIGLDVSFVALVNPVLAGSRRQLVEKGLQVVWREQVIQDEVAKRLSVPVVVEKIAHASAEGEIAAYEGQNCGRPIGCRHLHPRAAGSWGDGGALSSIRQREVSNGR